MKAFQRAPHYLLDARLMLAWAKALDEAGETDKARYVAARLKEFRNDQAAEFFAPCAAASAAAATGLGGDAGRAPLRPSRIGAGALPYQCLAPESRSATATSDSSADAASPASA